MQNRICKTLGNNIKRIRKAKGLTQDRLVELLGVEIKSLSLIETGRGFVSARTLEKLTDVLNVTAAELFDTDDNKEPEKIYNSILSNLELIKNNADKLETINLAIKSIL